jgi:glutamate formiminotransferase
MRILTVPNWSFGRSRGLSLQFRDVLDRHDLKVHYLQSDPDHNRTVSAFSGPEEKVAEALLSLCTLAFDAIDLNRHTGVHPRIGALDVCPFLPLDGELTPATLAAANGFVERVAATMAARHDVPVFLYEKSERGRHEADLPSLRRGGFGGLIGRELRPDFGPSTAHLRLGVTIMGVREFLLAVNVDLALPDPTVAKSIARDIRRLRSEGDPRFLGVRALGLPLVSRGESQVSMNLTLPDLTPVDPIVEYIAQQARDVNVRLAGTELIGVIRPCDLPGATRLKIRPEQIVS